MKKILFIFLIFMCGKFSHAQNPIPPDSNTNITQSVGNAPTTKVLTNILQAKKGIINATFADTTAANLFAQGYRIKYFPGAMVFSLSDSTLYIRNSTATRWLVSSAEGNSNVNVTYEQYGDNGVIICEGSGAAQVCDTFLFDIDSVTNVYPISDSEFVACQEPQVIQVGDVFTTQQLCDTITIPRIPNPIFTNGVQQAVQGIVEHGWASDGISPGQLNHNTYLYTLYSKYNITGLPMFSEVLKVQQYRNTGEGASIQSWNHQGISADNNVDFYRGYTDKLEGDSVGFVGDRIGYMDVTNALGSWYSLVVNNTSSKQTGILYHTKDTSNTDAVTIFGTQSPLTIPLWQDPSTTNFYDKRIAVFKTDGTVQFPYYPNTRNDGTAPMAFYPDADGNLKLGAVAGGGSITFDNDTVFICSNGDYLCDTFITTLTDPIQYVTVINDTLLRVCDTNGVCQNIDVGGTGGGSVGVDQKFFEPSQVQNTDTYHEMSKNFSVGINLTTSVSGVRNYNFLNGNTVSGSENVVWGRNMVVSGNTNFVAATDGTMASGNYSAVFGDANDVRATASLTGGFGNDAYVENGFVMGNDNVLGALSAGAGTANQYTGSWMLGAQNRSTGSNNGTLGYFVQNTGARAIVIGNGFGSTRFTNSMANVIAFTTNSDSATMYVHPAAGTSGSIGKVSIGTAAPTATRFEVVDNTLGAFSMINVLSNATTAASNLQKGVNVSLSGANANSNQTTYGVYVANTHTGTGAANYGVYSTINGAGAGVVGLGQTGGTGVYGETNTENGVYGAATTSGIGVRANANTGYGVYSISAASISGGFESDYASTNDVQPILEIKRLTSGGGGAGANGIGGGINFNTSTTTTGGALSNQIQSKWVDATHLSRTSQLDITGVNSATTQTIMSLAGSGQLTLNQYTTSNFNGGAAADSVLVVTSAGVVKKRNAAAFSGGGGGFSTADNGLSNNTATNVQLGGTIIQNTTLTDDGTHSINFDNVGEFNVEAGNFSGNTGFLYVTPSTFSLNVADGSFAGVGIDGGVSSLIIKSDDGSGNNTAGMQLSVPTTLTLFNRISGNLKQMTFPNYDFATYGTNNYIPFAVNGAVALSNGQVYMGYRAILGADAFTNIDYTIDCTSGTFALTLPTAAGITGRIYVVKNSGAGVITLTPQGGETIDGAGTKTVTAGIAVTVQSTGANWIIISVT